MIGRKNMISVIIPLYSSKYIKECLSSISSNIEFEILIGIDGNPQALECLKGIPNVFFFEKNVGPYVIKNTLIDVAKYRNILFFDGDDILIPNTIQDVYNKLLYNEYVKLNYVNFTEGRIIENYISSDAIMGIKKNIFNKLNGFYPWKCAADTEMDYRMKYNNLKTSKLEGISYYRRIHDDNLTIRKDTGHNSPIRNEYVKIINNNIKNNSWPSPEIKTISPYVKITTTN